MHDDSSSRTHLRVVDPHEVAVPDPFARAVCQPSGPPVLCRGSGRQPDDSDDADPDGLDDPDALDDEDLLAGLPDDPGLLVWPSHVWNAHEPDCDRPRRCVHLPGLEWPRWWVAKMRRYVPFDADIDKAIEMAMGRINTYRGGKHVSVTAAAFARDAVRDALPSAPQPVSKPWVHGSLATLGAFATWVENEGESLTRAHVFAEATRMRYLSSKDGGAAHLSEYSRRNYRLRLDIMASMLLGSPREVIKGRKSLGQPAALLPLTIQQEVDLWVWSDGLRPITVRDRLQAVLAMGLGVGCRRQEFVKVQGSDVTRDAYGVHVSFPESITTRKAITPARVVTCAAVWEDRLWDLVQQLETPEHYVAAPWRTTEPDSGCVDTTLRNAINDEAAAPPVDFSSETLRNTWMVRHLEAGTPLKLVMAQAALTSTVTCEKLLPYVQSPTGVQASALMRRVR